MSRKRILITGSNGYIGSNLEDYLQNSWQIYTTDLTESKKANFFPADISVFKSISKVIETSCPDVIVHTAGMSSLAKCEESWDLAERINVIGTKNIIRAINKFNPKIKLVFLSSDYVFDGERGNYSEKDIPKPKTIYGKNKLKSERDISKNLENYIIIRSANVYGRGGNFFNFLVRNLEESKPEKYFSNSFYTPTYIDYLLEAIKKLIEKNFKGLIHIVGKERTSRYSFALETAKAFGKSPSLVIESKQSEASLLSKDSSLNSNYSIKKLDMVSPRIRVSLDILFGLNKTDFKTNDK